MQDRDSSNTLQASFAARVRIGFAALILLALPSTAAQADEPKLSIDVGFETIESLSYAKLKLNNKGGKPQRVDSVIVKYGCINDTVEIADHKIHVTLAPSTSHEHEPAIVCAAAGGANAYKVIAVNESRNVVSDGNDLYYKIQCGDGFELYVTLTWTTKNAEKKIGYYSYKTASGETGTLSGKIVDDGSFFRLACSPSPPPFRKALSEAQEFVRKNLFSRKKNEPPQLLPRDAVPTGSGG